MKAMNNISVMNRRVKGMEHREDTESESKKERKKERQANML